MSRFFKASSGSSSESSSEDEPLVPNKPAGRPVTNVYMPSDSEEETKRVVRTAKDKHNEALRELIRQLNNSKKIKDMSKILELFEELCTGYKKAETALKKDQIDKQTPRFYLRYLTELDEFINENWEDRKAMNKSNSKGITTLRQKLRKYNKDFEDELVQYVATRGDGQSDDEEDEVEAEPEALQGDGESEESSDEDDSSDDEGMAHLRMVKPKLPKATKPAKVAAGSDSESDSDDEWASSTGESSESELSDLEGKKMEDLRRAEFRGGDAKIEREGKKKVKREKEGGKRKQHDKGDDEGWETVHRGAMVERPKMFEKDAEINPEVVQKKLIELLAARGKKSTDRKIMIEMLQELKQISEAHKLGPPLSIKIVYTMVATMFEYNVRTMDNGMKYDQWQAFVASLATINELFDILFANPDIETNTQIEEENENIIDSTQPIRIIGSVLSVVDRLDAEFTKILQNADCHSTDYLDKLKGETDLCALIERCREYLELKKFPTSEICEVYTLAIQHLYYKFDSASLDEETSDAAPTPTTDDQKKPVKTARERLEELCQYVYTQDHGRMRTRAILSHIYHHALHDRWHQARDLMLMSHLQSTIDHADAETQILCNRTVCQLGLCAFRHGFIKEAHHSLSEIQNTQRAKELLAQGMMQRGNEQRTPEQEKVLKSRQVPYHMHINVELMECVYLICSMLQEIPQIVSREYDMRRRMLSRSFHFQLKQSERSLLLGPPENTREHVVAAARAMLMGDWKATRDYIINDKMNTKVWKLFRRSDQVKEMVMRRIQEESLRTYLLTYTTVYSTVSLQFLSDMFELDKPTVHALISKLIINEELLASIDEPTACVVMHRTEPSRLQYTALQLTEKLQQLADNNDQILEPKPAPGYAARGQDGQGGRGGGGNRGGRDGWQNRNQGGRGGGRGRGRGGHQGGYQSNRNVRWSRD